MPRTAAVLSLAVLSFAVLLVAAPLAAAQPAQVVLVRHAEKAGEDVDPPLSAAGSARAAALHAALADAGVAAIVVSHRRRTADTAAPLARALGVVPQVVSAGGDLASHVADVAAAVRRHPGSVVLVVGHSNTVPAIIAALGGPRLPDLGDEEYDRLFVLTGNDGRIGLVQARYGAPAGVATPAE